MVFAQRIRHQIQARFNFSGNVEFKKGLYIKLQNEIFLNVQNKQKINNEIFDQNRPYIGIGYRANKKLEMETGYYYRYQIMEDASVGQNIFQLMIITDL